MVVGLWVNSATGQSQVDFSRDVQPILSENCYFCHGPDPKERKADLRLDLEEDAREWFEPGQPEESELFLRISTDDRLDLMPPPNSHRVLSAEQIETIRRWIQEGGEWGQHWSFAPIEKPQVDLSSIRASKIAMNEIDFFVNQTLREKELEFSPEANRRSLIRRVSIDLTGLPPTLEQIEQFMSDESPEAYSKMVDRFLESPSYGERMAWDWLDAARYADSNGYQGDNERTMWPWRDWVVDAYNENMPFDQFSKWQLAGDLIPSATTEQTLATAFNRNHPINGEGGRIAEENRIDYVMDMSETAGTIWMGLTFNCCRCHDHKYDQLSQKDYYSFFAFFNQTPVTGEGGNAQTPPILSVPDLEQRNALARFDRQIEEIEQQIQSRVSELSNTQRQWENEVLEELSQRVNRWEALFQPQFEAEASTLEKLEDHSFFATGDNPKNDVYRVQASSPLKVVTGVRLEALTHSSHTQGGLARSSSSNFVLTDFEVYLVGPDSEAMRVEIATALADFEQPGHSVEFAIDADSATGWAVNPVKPNRHQDREAVFRLADPLNVPEGSELRFVLRHESIHSNHNIGRFRISLTESEPELVGSKFKLLDALNTLRDQRSPGQEQLIAESHQNADDTHARLVRSLGDVNDRRERIAKSVPKVMVMDDMDTPRRSYVLNRGSYQEPLAEVFPRVPSMLSPINAEIPGNRMALANWLFRDSNPLTPRVSVNRLWAQVFGIGLVKTTEDFGVQGEPPSHPELLDWLAAEYRDSGWNTKHMLRLILNSRTYRQSSKVNRELLEIDPNNRLLGRAPRFRMPSWMIRDYALAASGLLVHSTGGKPVNSYQPPGVWEESSFGTKKYELGTGDEIYRRSIYTFWRRIAAPTMFFDNADRMTCSVKALRTNTPLHALTTLNDITFVEASRILATGVLRQDLDDTSRLSLVFESILSRCPDKKEQRILLAALERTVSQFRQDENAARDFVMIGESEVAKELDTIELASWTSLCLAVFNLDEALTRQ